MTSLQPLLKDKRKDKSSGVFYEEILNLTIWSIWISKTAVKSRVCPTRMPSFLFFVKDLFQYSSNNLKVLYFNAVANQILILANTLK